MTLQQEAIQLINRMPDENIRAIIGVLHVMNPKPVNNKENDRMEALKWMRDMHEKTTDESFADLNIEKELQMALEEKYGCLD